MKQRLLAALDQVERYAKGTKWQRLTAAPVRYIHAISFRETRYRFSRTEQQAIAPAFFGKTMQIALPAGTDIYLTGGKTHDSEIRLARFMIHQLSAGNTFVDIGAHFGYFSLLAASLIGDTGKIYAFEAAKRTFSHLAANLNPLPNSLAIHAAVNANGQQVTFFEFDPLHSEFNSTDISQFEGQPWFERHKPTEVKVAGLQLSAFLQQEGAAPDLIKIDVEGGEAAVIQGALPWLEQHPATVVIEYLSPERSNQPHQEAARLLLSIGYTPAVIQADGSLLPLKDIEQWFAQHNVESDNIVFVHRNKQKAGNS